MSGIGVNLRVTGHCNQGGRKYMEDMFSVAYQQTEDLNDLEYAFFGIFDGHGGVEAATYAKEHLLDSIVQQKLFWSDSDDDVLHAIHEGYLSTHQAMWKEQAKWQRTASGLPSTSGTTATVAFIMRSKIYVGHVGDSMLVLGYHDEEDKAWKCLELTKEHKPECPEEIKRITKAGGKVVRKNGVPRVVWNRPKTGHKGPVRRSTAFDEIPFLAVARALGDFWSYNADLDTFTVSPEPDVGVIEMDTLQHKCLIFGTDGLWNVLSAQDAVDIVHFTEMRNEETELSESNNWINPSKCLVDEAIEKWNNSRSRADNTSVVTLLIDPPGPPPQPKSVKSDSGCQDGVAPENNTSMLPQTRGMAIFTRNPGSPKQELLNSLFKQSAVQPSSNKIRSIANILRPYEQIVKSKQPDEDQHPNAGTPAAPAPTHTPPCPPSPHSSPSPSSSGSLRSSGSASVAACPSIASTTRSSSNSSTSPRSSNSSLSALSSASVPSTRSSSCSNSVSSSASVPTTRSTNGLPSVDVPSTRSSNNCSASVSNCLPSVNVPSTRSSNNCSSASVSPSAPRNNTSVPSTRSSSSSASLSSSASVARSTASSSMTSSSSGRGATRVMANQSAILSSTRRKRFRMDEKRSSLPLNIGFEESSGNSDTENEQRLSLSPSPLVAALGGKMKRRHQSSASPPGASPQHPPAPSTRTLRSDTLASLPVKTLRSRNINLNTPPAAAYPSPTQPPATPPTRADVAAARRLRWNKR